MPKAAKSGFYAVARGRVPGIYTDWDLCYAQVSGYTGNKYKKFATAEEAKSYLSDNHVPLDAVSSTTSSSTLSSVPSSSSPRGHRQHRAGPYDNLLSRPSAAKSVTKTSGKGSRWKALSSEVIQDESGWDVVYSDGACKGNGKPGSLAGIGVWWGVNDSRNIAERCPGAQTNNRAELIAIIRVLETTPHSPKPLLIKTDSKYSISCFRDWLPKWLENNFKSSTGQPVKNELIIRYLDALIDLRARRGQKVHLQYVKGHAGEEGNEGADKLANYGATMSALEDEDWDALIAKVGDEVGAMPSSLHNDRVAEITQGELEAYAAGLVDNNDLLAEVNDTT